VTTYGRVCLGVFDDFGFKLREGSDEETFAECVWVDVFWGRSVWDRGEEDGSVG
jgi:hypothetical protein